MDATTSGPVFGSRGSWRPRQGLLAALMMVGLLVQGCSDNNGRVTSTKTPTTGFANTAADIRVQVGVNPNTITPGQRAGVTAFVTNLNGHPLAGKQVQFSTDVGSLDVTVGTTNALGQFSTFLRITATDVANASAGAANGFATVTAFVEGAVGTGQVNFGGNPLPPVPAPLTLSPPSVTLSQDVTSPATCTFNVQFTAAGGTPPLSFSSGVPGAVNGSGLYTQTGVLEGTTVTDTVTVTDSAGQTASASVSLECK